MENFQLVFNIIIVGFAAVGGLLVSYGAKIKKATSSGDKSLALLETLGAGVILFFLIVIFFVVGLSGE